MVSPAGLPSSSIPESRLPVSAPTSTIAAAESATLSARNRQVIWLLLAASFVVILNETIMNVALRALMIDLHISAVAAQWLSSAFMLTMAVVIPVTGFLLQRFNTRPLFITAMGLFSTGTLIAALAPGFPVLLGARIIQASGTAIMMPLLMTTLMTLVPTAQRGKMMGNVSIVISVAPALGPTISGVILNLLSWRWMFGLVLPLAVVMLVIGIRRVKNVSEPRAVPIDMPSVVLSAFGFGGIVYGLSKIGTSTDTADATSALSMWISLSVGVVALVVFVLRQLRLQRQGRALLDLRTFHSPVFSLATAIMVVTMLGLFGTLIVLPIYLLQVLHLEPVATGLLLLPGGLVMGLLAPFVGRAYDRVGPKPLVIPGSFIAGAAMWTLAFVSKDTSPFMVLGAHIVLSIGLALMFTPLFTAGLGAVKPDMYSHGSAIIGTVQQVAGAAGAALFVTLMSAQTATLLASGVSADAAAAGGVRVAFLAGAIIFLFAIAGSFFIRKPMDGPAA